MKLATRFGLALLWLAVGICGARASQTTPPIPPPPRAIAVPFELHNKLIYLPVRVNGSRPLTFLFDTGGQTSIVDLSLARDLRLDLQGVVQIQGVGPQRLTGLSVRNARAEVVGAPGFSQPIGAAFPIARDSRRNGHGYDGVLGGDFLQHFVVEIDYAGRVLRLHDPSTFTYRAPGRSLAIEVRSGHPILQAAVTPIGAGPIQGEFLLDVGSGLPLALNSPFVSNHGLVNPGNRTIRAYMVVGTGGRGFGRIGRVETLTLGPHVFSGPITFFSMSQSGATSGSRIEGVIGQPVLSRFRLFFDYAGKRLILEPTARISEPFEYYFAGFSVEARGDDFKTFFVRALLENSPASEAGMKLGDVITAVDGHEASELSLTALGELFERPVRRTLRLRRGEQTLTIALTPRALI